MGEGETHRWKPKLPFGPKSGGEDSYDDGYDGRGYDDRGYDDREYDDRGYDDRGYDDRGYDDRGYEGGRYGSRGYDDRGYDDYAAYDQEGGGEYDRSRYGSEEFEQQEENVILRYLYENEWLMWVLLVVLPPLGIWILWKRDRFDIMVRSIISAVSAIWFIIALVWMFGGFRGRKRRDDGPERGRHHQPGSAQRFALGFCRRFGRFWHADFERYAHPVAFRQRGNEYQQHG